MALQAESWARVSRTPIPERGIWFDPQNGEEDGFIDRTIHKYPWTEFVQPPGDFYADLAFEFYRNLNRNTQFSNVQGVQIDYSPDAINALYQIPTVDDSTTLDFMHNPNFNLIEKTLCYFGANWNFDSAGAKCSVKSRNLRYQARPLLAFVSSRLLPNTNKHEIFKDRLALTFVIYNAMPLDVGKYMFKQIQNCRYRNKAKTLFFPSTITRLILNAGVLPRGPKTISNKFITKKSWLKLGASDGPLRQTGEEEPFSRRRITYPIPGVMQVNMELMLQYFEDVKRIIQFNNNQRREFEAKLIKKVERMDNFLLQHSAYTTSLLWGFANYVTDMGTAMRYSAPIDFLPFVYVDPEETIPMSQPTPVPETIPMSQPTPVPEAIPVNQSTPVPEHQPESETPRAAPFEPEKNANIFGEFADFCSDFDDYNTLFPVTGGPTIREQSSNARDAKRTREAFEKGKSVMEHSDDIYCSGWREVPVTRLRRDDGKGDASGSGSIE